MSVEKSEKPRCIACQGEARKIGEVPYSFHFLQHSFLAPLDSGDLYECLRCGLWFKYPFLPASEIANFYENSPSSFSWDNDEQRSDYLCVISVLKKALPQGGAVLDFGCYKGGFLRLLPDNFRRHGIEPSEAASQVAASCKVEVLGPNLSWLRDQQFDCITLFDVFEHLLEPLEVLDTLFARIRPGGLFCIGTGFADSPAFRRAGSKYSYVCMPEHSCFLTRQFLTFLADRFRSDYEFSTISRTSPKGAARIRSAAINCINSFMLVLKTKRAIYRCYPTHRLRVITSKGLLPVIATEDHGVVIFRKPVHGMTENRGQATGSVHGA